MDNTKLLSIVIPVRIDSEERLANLQAVVRFLLYCTESPIIILEADTKSCVWGLEESNRILLVFKKDDDVIFHRTKYINELLELAQTPFVGVWDTDIILNPRYIREALVLMEQGCAMCLPYSGKCIFLYEETSNLVRHSVTTLFQDEHIGVLEGFCLSRPSVGGAYIVNRVQYISSGGENEMFYGWGPEDAERVKRIEILGHQVMRTEGCFYHLHHPRGINSTLGNDTRSVQNLNEFCKVCSLLPKELIRYTSKMRSGTLIHKKKLVVVGNKPISYPLVDTFDYVIRINRMTNYGDTGYRTDGLYLEANDVFKSIYTGKMLKERISEDTHIFMHPDWHKKFEEWPDFLSVQQYALTELVDYATICTLINCSNPTSGVTLLAHLLSTDWVEEYDIHIVGFELQNRVEMIDKDPYWSWHHGAGVAELSYLNRCIESGVLKVLEPLPTP